jgi:hypothetical protein
MTETGFIAAKPRAYGLIALYSRAETTSNRQKHYNGDRME